MKCFLVTLVRRFGLCPLFLVFVLLLPCSGYSWTLNKWLGVIEAVGGTVTAVKSDNITPVGDTCDNCGGSGRVGDGTVSVECAACDGTGKKKKQEAPKEDSAVNAASSFRCTQFG